MNANVIIFVFVIVLSMPQEKLKEALPTSKQEFEIILPVQYPLLEQWNIPPYKPFFVHPMQCA